VITLGDILEDAVRSDGILDDEGLAEMLVRHTPVPAALLIRVAMAKIDPSSTEGDEHA
jgi:hypothetical protein